MKIRTILLGSAVAALLAAGGWYGWRWYTTPAPPAVPLEGLSEDTAEVVTKAQREVRSGPHFGPGLRAAGREDEAAGWEQLALVKDDPSARKRACALLAKLSGDREQAQAYRKLAADLPAEAEWPDPFREELKRYRVDLSRH